MEWKCLRITHQQSYIVSNLSFITICDANIPYQLERKAIWIRGCETVRNQDVPEGQMEQWLEKWVAWRAGGKEWYRIDARATVSCPSSVFEPATRASPYLPSARTWRFVRWSNFREDECLNLTHIQAMCTTNNAKIGATLLPLGFWAVSCNSRLISSCVCTMVKWLAGSKTFHCAPHVADFSDRWKHTMGKWTTSLSLPDDCWGYYWYLEQLRAKLMAADVCLCLVLHGNWCSRVNN